MANDFSSNPIRIDSAFSTGDFATKTNVFIRSLVWMRPTTVGHRLTITDVNGDIVVDEKCAVANENVPVSYICGWVRGIKCTLIDSGEVLVYL
jgi:hypothetical protein